MWRQPASASRLISTLSASARSAHQARRSDAYVLAVESAMVSGPGTVILTGFSVAACATCQSRTRKGAPAATLPVKVGTSAVHAPFRMVRSVSVSGSKPCRWLQW